MSQFTNLLRRIIASKKASTQTRPAPPKSSLLLEELESRQLLSITINPTFAANITSDPNSAAIIATINRTIAAYQSFIGDNITVDITFQEGGGLGGSSGGLGYFIKYKDYRAALVTHSTTGNDTTAIASLPVQDNDPVTNSPNLFIRSPLARALGFTAPSAGGAAGDGTITLNTSICNLDRTSVQDPAKYDLQAVVAHEIDEILGFGSSMALGLANGAAAPTSNIAPDDLFRYDQNGARSFDTLLATQAYFSFDGGATRPARFNQTGGPSGGDWGDWYSPGGQTPQVQDAFGTAGATQNLGVELTRFDVLGYTLSALGGPAVTAPANNTAVEGASKSFALGSFTDPNAAPWGVTVDWGDGSTDTTFFLNNAGSLGSKSHKFAEEGSFTVTVTVTDFTSQSQSKTFQVEVSDPAVIASGVTINAVEGANTGSVTVATFTDPGGPEPVSDYSAVIDWGDGSATTSGTIVFSGGSTFAVKGSHTYAEESAADHLGSNPYAVTVTISHESAPDATANSTAVVADPAVVPTSVVINAVEGASTGVVTVATFTDPGGAEPLSDYSAVIDWGDGTATDVGSITFSAGVFTVSGSHTYAEESAADHSGSNPYAVTVTISHESAPDAIANSTAVVADPAVIATGGFNFIAVEGQLSTVQTVATFTDPGGAEPLSDYSALINWGDGTAPSAGTISFADGVFTVRASHLFASGLGNPSDFGNTFCDAVPPSFHKPINVTISHEDAPTSLAVSDAMVSLKPGSARLSSDGSLIIVGTAASDGIAVNNVGGKKRMVTVKLGTSTDLGTFTVGATGRIVVAGMNGSDNVQIASGVLVESVLYGGPGNDRLKGGGARNILVGCEGDDTLTAGNAGDLLVGGRGADRITGGNGKDILIAGTLVDASNNEDDRYADLVTVLTTGFIPASLGAANDNSVDKLTGGAGIDTFYYHYLGLSPFDIVSDSWEIRFNI